MTLNCHCKDSTELGLCPHLHKDVSMIRRPVQFTCASGITHGTRGFVWGIIAAISIGCHIPVTSDSDRPSVRQGPSSLSPPTISLYPRHARRLCSRQGSRSPSAPLPPHPSTSAPFCIRGPPCASELDHPRDRNAFLPSWPRLGGDGSFPSLLSPLVRFGRHGPLRGTRSPLGGLNVTPWYSDSIVILRAGDWCFNWILWKHGNKNLSLN